MVGVCINLKVFILWLDRREEIELTRSPPLFLNRDFLSFVRLHSYYKATILRLNKL